MKNKKKNRVKDWKRILICLMLGVLLVSMLSTAILVMAAPTDSQANSTSRSMIQFFRDDRTKLDTNRVSRDEIMVYGIFLSNFFTPGQTTLKDIKADGDKSLTTTVANKFFGSAAGDKKAEVTSLNTKIYDAISKVLTSDSKSFGMYANAEDAKNGRVMTGMDFYKKMATGDSTIVNNNGNPLFDLSDQATRGAIQVLFGFSPELILDKDKGLRNVSSMYMDGLGNIWGAYRKDGSSIVVDDYVLILPSCLNPVVFSNTTKGCKFPITNAFAMGAVLRIQGDFLSDAEFMTPYYNIKNYFYTGSSDSARVNKENLTTILGVQSPLDYVGNSDILIKSTSQGNPNSIVDSYVRNASNAEFDSSKAKVIISMDASKVPDDNSYFKNNSDLDSSQKGTLLEYLTSSNDFKLTQLMDDMYYFSGVNGANGDQGDWKNNDSLIKSQKLFAIEKQGKYTFYNGSFSASPFNRFLLQFKEAGNKDDFLSSWLQSYAGKSVSTSSASFKALKSFLDTGNFGTNDSKTINDAMLLMQKNGTWVFNILPNSDVTNTTLNKFEFFKPAYINLSSFGLTEYDSYILNMSYAIKNRFIYNSGLSDSNAFKVGNNGGSLGNNSGGGITNEAQNVIGSLFYSMMTYRVFSMSSYFTSQLTSTTYAGTSIDGAMGKYTTKTAVMNDVNNWPGIYWGYMVNLLAITEDADGNLNNTKNYSNAVLPYMVVATSGGVLDLKEALTGSGVASSENKTLEEMQKDIIRKVYGLLSDDNSTVRDKLIKSSQDSWVISTHRAITGSWVGNTLSVSSGGNNAYASIVGYINTPNLNELPLTSWLLSDYMSVYVFLLLLALVVVLLLGITNTRTVRECLALFITMCFVLILPKFLLSNVVGITNSIGDKIYSEKFNYWAITQHQQSSTTLKSAASTGNELDYITAKSMQDNANVYSSDVGVRVKWMSPKKEDAFNSLFTKKASANLKSNMTLFRWLFNSTLNQEEYVYDDPLATYLYRPYNAIASSAADNYVDLRNVAINKDSIIQSIRNAKGNVLGIEDYKFNKLLDPSKSNVSMEQSQKDLVDSVSTYYVSSDKEKLSAYRYWLMGNNGVTSSIFKSNYDATNAGLTGYSTDPYAEAFLLSTESPFYYFYNALRARYDGVNGGFKSALLSRDVFTIKSDNRDVDGKLRDFLDMEGLFTYVIPYLNQSNAYVNGWTAKYGKEIEGFNFSTGQVGGDGKNAELQAQYQEAENKKRELENVWKLYAPWVDQLYSSDVLNKKVSVAKTKVTVADILDPSAYEEQGRPMIFSEADMFAKKYKSSDLTTSEMKIQEVLDATYKDMMYLANYFDFNDDVLVTAAAMDATFNFNRIFSENRLLGESNVLYPQGFELKNFNYDAFMRLTLLNTTGEALMDSKDLYVRVLDKTSIVTGALLIVEDIIAVIVIPAVKIIVLLLLFILAITISIGCVIETPERITKTVLKHIGLPSILFMISTVIFALVVSLCMGDGLTSYVGGRLPSFGMTDPTITLLILIIFGLIYVYCLIRIALLLLKGIKLYGTASVFGAMGLIATVAQGMMSRVQKGVNGVKDTAFGAMGTASNLRNRRIARDRHNELVDAIRGGNDDGDSRSSFGGTSTKDDKRNNANINDNKSTKNTTQPKDDDFIDNIEELTKTRNPNVDVNASKDNSKGSKKSDSNNKDNK
ncbi:hypothetical protein D3C81_10390 [compost metagenome]